MKLLKFMFLVLLVLIACKTTKITQDTKEVKKDSSTFISSNIVHDTIIHIQGDTQVVFIPQHDTIFLHDSNGIKTIITVKGGQSTIQVKCPDKDLLIEKQRQLISSYELQKSDSSKVVINTVQIKYTPKFVLYSCYGFWVLFGGFILYGYLKIRK